MFVTFEGPDGAGKSTALHAVAEALRSEGRTVVTTREPGDSSIGPRVRQLLLEGYHVEPAAELFLYLADRSQHVSEVIQPALDRGEVVLCDRYADSTVVYQGYGRRLDIEFLRRLNDMATGRLRPGLTLLLDLDSELAMSRLKGHDRLDREPLEFHRKIRQGFLAEAARDPARWAIVDASQAPDEVTARCLELVRERIAAGSPTS